MTQGTAGTDRRIVILVVSDAGTGGLRKVLLADVAAVPVAPPVLKTDREMLEKQPENRDFRRGNKKVRKNWKPKRVW